MNGSSTSLSDIVDVSISSFQKVKDIAIFGGAYIFFMDGEKYRALNNIRTHSYFKKRCLEEFKKIKVPEVIH